jgi:hypothetical protein
MEGYKGRVSGGEMERTVEREIGKGRWRSGGVILFVAIAIKGI